MRRLISASLAVGLVAIYNKNSRYAHPAHCSAPETSSVINSGRSALSPKNYAFVFIKPHANTFSTRRLVSDTLQNRGIRILSEGEITGEQIDRDMLVDQHYYAIASKATILKPKDLTVSSDKFKEKFGNYIMNFLYSF